MKNNKLQAADLFCGAGGFTSGAEASNKVHVCLAVNHWRTAIYTHQANHPNTRHICARIDDIDPRHDDTIPELDLLMASPECTHHSIARGGRPIDDQKRATPWHVCQWAEVKRPRWLLIENVREFRDWGPLIQKRDKNGKVMWNKDGTPYLIPDPQHKGEIFRQWIKALEAIGYQMDCQILNAADFGAATKRLRLFMVGRLGHSKRDIPWPEVTHAGRWVPAWQIIDWSKPCPSIFSRKRPLAEKTLRRIEIGLRKFVGEAANPFIVTLRQHGEGRSIADPMPTITAGGEHHGLAFPFMVNYHGGTDPQRDGTERSCGVDGPIPVISTENRYGLAMPFIVPHFGERDGQEPRTHSTDEPTPTVTGQGAGSLCIPFQFKALGRNPGLTKGINEPIPTIVAARENHSIVVPFMQTLSHGGRERSLEEPLPTITTAHRGEHAITLPFLTKYYGNGAGAVSMDEPLPTVTTKDHCGLAMVSLLQTMKELHVVDIGFRMLDVDELARAQGFPENYQLYGTKAEQVRQVGNAVCPPVAKAICETLAEAS